MKIDLIDKKIITQLQKDAKQTNKEIAGKINMSVTAVYERIKRLERDGVIKRYVAIIDKAQVDRSLMVFCQIKLSQHTKKQITQFEEEVVKLQEVIACFHTSGDYDYILKISVENMNAYRTFMVNKLSTIKHIGSSHSIFCIEEVKHTTSIPL